MREALSEPGVREAVSKPGARESVIERGCYRERVLKGYLEGEEQGRRVRVLRVLRHT